MGAESPLLLGDSRAVIGKNREAVIYHDPEEVR